MSLKGFDQLISSAKRRNEYLKNYISVAKRVKKLVNEKYAGAKIYVFGSTVRGTYTAASDIDVLVVLPKDLSPDERAELMARVFMDMPDAPVELHITDEKGLNWYMRFIKKEELVEV